MLDEDRVVKWKIELLDHDHDISISAHQRISGLDGDQLVWHLPREPETEERTLIGKLHAAAPNALVPRDENSRILRFSSRKAAYNRVMKNPRVIERIVQSRVRISLIDEEAYEKELAQTKANDLHYWPRDISFGVGLCDLVTEYLVSLYKRMFKTIIN